MSASLPSVRLGNPVSLVTGTKTQAETDLELDGAPLGFRRTYSSAASDADIGLGHGWRHSFAVSLYATEDGGRQIVESSGRHIPFAADGRRFVPALDSDGYLVDMPVGHEWHLPDGRTLYFRGQWLWRIEWPGHRRLTLRYTPAGLASVTDETGRRLRFEWVPGGRGVPIYRGGDAQLPPGHLSALVLPDGKRVQFAYDARLNLTGARYPDGTARRYHYEAPYWPNHLTGLTERTGTRFATWRYDAAGRAISSEHADGVERVTLDYGPDVADGEIGTTTVTNSAGAASVYSYTRHVPSGASLLLTADGPGCRSCPPTGRRYAYDGARLVSTTVLDELGNVVAVRRRSHDAADRLLSLAETRTATDGTPVERLVERREYVVPDDADTGAPGNAPGDLRPRLVARPSVDPSAEHVTETVRGPDGLTKAIIERGRTPTFDATGAPTGFDAIERTVRFEHDASGRLIAIDGPREDVDDRTRLEWDEANRLVALVPPASPALRVTRFDGSGRPAELRIGTRTPLALERDADGNVTAVRRGENVVRYEHDPESRLVGIVDPDGRRTTIEHDAAGRVASVTDDLGRVDALVHDTESRVVGRSRLGIDGSMLRSMEYLFDAHGRLIRSVERGRAADGSAKAPVTLAHEPGANGLFRRLTNPDTGIAAGSDIDLLARLTTFTAPDGSSTAIEHDAAGRDVALTDARGNITRYPADDFGRIVLLDSPDTGTVRHFVDAAGNRVRTILADGRTVDTRFDAANRPVERTGPDGTTTWRHGAADEPGAHGLLVEAASPTTTERFAYDADGRLIRHERSLDGHAFETRHTYDARGRLASKRLPDGQKLTYHYHDSGPDRAALRAITRGRWWGMADETVVGEIDLDARDGRAGWISGTGVRTEQRFAATGELVGLEVGQALRLDYEFDAAGRIVGIDDNAAAHRYGYVGGRLVSATGPDGRLGYSYDALGNRTASVRRDAKGTTAATLHTYPPAGEGNRLLQSVDTVSGLTTDYRYDAAGAPLTSGTLSWRYDANRRPVEAWRDGKLVATYAYNAFGERVRKVVHSGPGKRPTITYFLYDGTTLVAEADEAGEIVAQYVYLDSHRAVAKLEGRAQYAIHGDHLGTPRLMTDESGEVVWEAEYAPFGEATLVREDAVLNLRLPGQYADAETGTHYNYLRDYDPATGRYLTSDPIGLAGGVNGYAYVGANPVGAIDPLGLFELPPPGSALYRELVKAGILSAVDGPIPVGDAVAGALLLVYFVDNAIGGLTERILYGVDLGVEYRALYDEILRFDPNYATHTPWGWEPGIEDVRELAQRLYVAQVEYLSRDWCGADIDAETYERARDSVEFSTVTSSAVRDHRTPLDDWLRREYEDYRANGGEIDSLVDWVALGMPSRNVGRGTDPAWLLAHNTQTHVLGNKRRIIGAHSLPAFEQTALQLGIRIEGRRQVAPGVEHIRYRVPKLDRAMNPVPGEYAAEVYQKTVYDPAVYSDNQVAALGAEAARKAQFTGSAQTETTVSVGTLYFRVYRNLETGEVTNAHVTQP